MSDEFPEFFDLVSNVRAMRRLKPDPVPLELIHKVLNAGVQAPSGQNLQPWAFVLLSDPAGKQWFAEQTRDITDDLAKEVIDGRAGNTAEVGDVINRFTSAVRCGI